MRRPPPRCAVRCWNSWTPMRSPRWRRGLARWWGLGPCPTWPRTNGRIRGHRCDWVGPLSCDAVTTTTADPALARLGTRPRLADYLRTMWQRREFAAATPRAELESQHRNTVLGSVWHLLDPFILVGVYYLIFGVLVSLDRGVDNLVGFLAIGVFVWHFTTKSVKSGAKSITTN